MSSFSKTTSFLLFHYTGYLVFAWLADKFVISKLIGEMTLPYYIVIFLSATFMDEDIRKHWGKILNMIIRKMKREPKIREEISKVSKRKLKKQDQLKGNLLDE